MSRGVFLHPGQGSQYAGMGRVYAGAPVARDLLAHADEVLGFSLSALCLHGSELELRRTENAQPALFVVSVMASLLLAERGLAPTATAGHSVGEYAALVTAGALSFEAGLRAVRCRGELMAEQCERTPGTMAAVIGVPLETVRGLCAAAGDYGVVAIANENGPTQTVISGEHPAVARVLDLAEQQEGGVAIELNVAGAFHSPLMAPVAERMAAVLAAVPFQAPRIPFVANVSADYVTAPAAVRDALVRQITSSVRWGAALLRLAADGASQLVEAGPGRVLTRLARDIAPELPAVAAEDLLAATMTRALPAAHG